MKYTKTVLFSLLATGATAVTAIMVMNAKQKESEITLEMDDYDPNNQPPKHIPVRDRLHLKDTANVDFAKEGFQDL